MSRTLRLIVVMEISSRDSFMESSDFLFGECFNFHIILVTIVTLLVTIVTLLVTIVTPLISTLYHDYENILMAVLRTEVYMDIVVNIIVKSSDVDVLCSNIQIKRRYHDKGSDWKQCDDVT